VFNQVGRTIFNDHKEKTLEEVMRIVLELAKNSVKITKQFSLEKHQFSLVHLTD